MHLTSFTSFRTGLTRRQLVRRLLILELLLCEVIEHDRVQHARLCQIARLARELSEPGSDTLTRYRQFDRLIRRVNESLVHSQQALDRYNLAANADEMMETAH
jgi:hypothetical protein